MLFRKLLRTAWKYKTQFISMIIMIAIGAGVFVGMNMEWYSLKRDTSLFFEQTNFADYRIFNEKGFSESDIEAVRAIDGVTDATRVLAVNVGVKDAKQSLALFVAESDSVSSFYSTSGAEYDETSDGFWLSDKFAAANGISAGDTLTVTYLDFEISGEVVGLGKSAEHMICVADENQLMPDYNTFGFVYASPKKISAALGAAFYSQINLISDLGKTDVELRVTAALGQTTLVLSKDENYSYAGAQSEIEEGQTMGAVLPVLFLLIGILTMITTMHRITANEKTQIGTLKALGFRDRRILRHYISYGFVLGVVGCLLGIGFGFGFAYLIVSPNGMESTYMDMPAWDLYIPRFCWLALVATVVALTFICFLSVKKMLKGNAADALRPYAPKKMKPLTLEKTKLWNRLSFATKWNLRDVMRHKSRSVMTLIGVIGCMILLVGGMGMQDTMTVYLDVIDNVVFHYETRVNLSESAERADVEEFVQQQNADWVASSNVQYEGKAVALEIYDVTHDKIRFLNEANKQTAISDDGVYLCLRLSDNISVGQTIRFSPYGSDRTYTVTVAGFLRSVLTENIVMSRAYAEQTGIGYTITSVFTDTPISQIAPTDFIASTQTKESLMESYDSFMEIMNVMVLLFVIAAVVLGIVVLYNLGVMSYVERYRELATLKVVGFRDKRIGGILISQNIWLTVIGVLLGLPAGIGVLYVLITALASEYELRIALGALTYIVSILVTFGVSLVVSLFIALKNKKIDMVEALKGAE